MFIGAYVVASVLVAWFILITLTQLPEHWCPSLLKPLQHDRFHLLPKWNFFAPNPGTQDYHVFMRAFDSSGVPGEWREHYPVEDRSFTSSFWNPKKRYRKTIADLVQIANLTTANTDGPCDAALILSVSYLAFLNSVSAELRVQGAHACQFAIFQSEGKFVDRVGDLVFRSNVHPCVG